MQIFNWINVILANIKTAIIETGIFAQLASLTVYIVLGYLSCAFIKEDFQFARGIPRMIVFSLLIGWAAIPIALVLLIFRAGIAFFNWLFDK